MKYKILLMENIFTFVVVVGQSNGQVCVNAKLYLIKEELRIEYQLLLTAIENWVSTIINSNREFSINYY